MDNITEIASDLWNELAAAALVEPPLKSRLFMMTLLRWRIPPIQAVIVDETRGVPVLTC
jgi:hypothetical protein